MQSTCGIFKYSTWRYVKLLVDFKSLRRIKSQNTASHFVINFIILLEIFHLFRIWTIWNNYPTTCSGVLLEKLIFSHLAKKLRCSKELLTPHILSQISAVPHYLKIRTNIIRPSPLGSLSCLFPSNFPTKALFGSLLCPIPATRLAHLILLDFIIPIIFGGECGLSSISLCNLFHSPLTSSILGPNIFLRAYSCKFSAYFLPHCERTFHLVKKLVKILVFITVRLIWSIKHVFWCCNSLLIGWHTKYKPPLQKVKQKSCRSAVDCVWNVMAHAQKPDFFYQRNGRVHLNRRGLQFCRLLTAELCASAVVMLDTPRSEVVWRVLAAHSVHVFLSIPHPCVTVCHHISTALYLNCVPRFPQNLRTVPFL